MSDINLMYAIIGCVVGAISGAIIGRFQVYNTMIKTNLLGDDNAELGEDRKSQGSSYALLVVGILFLCIGILILFGAGALTGGKSSGDASFGTLVVFGAIMAFFGGFMTYHGVKMSSNK